MSCQCKDKLNKWAIKSVTSIKDSCVLFAKRATAHTVHVTWIVVGLRTTGLCNRTMTSPSSFCTCLWSTPWAGGLISVGVKKRNDKEREKERGGGGIVPPTLCQKVYSVLHNKACFITILEWEKSRWIDGFWTKKCIGNHNLIWKGALKLFNSILPLGISSLDKRQHHECATSHIWDGMWIDTIFPALFTFCTHVF